MRVVIKQKLANDYHKVHRSEIEKATHRLTGDTRRRLLEEFKERVNYTKRHFKGRYDARHRWWMKKLTNHITTVDRLYMSLDACAVSYSMK